MDQPLPAMWKLFLAIMISGASMGVAFPLVLRALPTGVAPWFPGVLLGAVYAFVMYVFVKSMLRAFVLKLHTLERVVAGTTPPELPGVLFSNEIDEVEQSAARIIARLDATRAEVGS